MNIGTLLSQPAFPDLCPVTDAVRSLAAAGQEERGAIFTRREVVDFMLDLVGYVPSEPLHRRRALEPSFGGGDFLLPMIRRLLAAWSLHDGTFAELAGALRAVELHALSYTETRAEVAATLAAAGLWWCSGRERSRVTPAARSNRGRVLELLDPLGERQGSCRLNRFSGARPGLRGRGGAC